MKKMYLYSRYERFWHWLQMMFIVILMITGFEVNGLYILFGYKTAVAIHSFVGVTWLIAFFVFVFWLFTTGEWRQYIPTTKKMFDVVRYYMFGIFKGEARPTASPQNVGTHKTQAHIASAIKTTASIKHRPRAPIILLHQREMPTTNEIGFRTNT